MKFKYALIGNENIIDDIVKKHELKDNTNRGGVVTNKYSQ